MRKRERAFLSFSRLARTPPSRVLPTRAIALLLRTWKMSPGLERAAEIEPNHKKALNFMRGQTSFISQIY